MDYYKIEHKNQDYYANDRNAIAVGPASIFSTHYAVDPKTLEVHQRLETQARAPVVSYSRFNDTERLHSEGEQLPLFYRTVSNPSSFHIETAFGTERGRTHAMLMGAMAKARADDMFGPMSKITTSEDLSANSLKLVRHAKEKGLIDNRDIDIPDEPTNSIRFDNPRFGLHTIDSFWEIDKNGGVDDTGFYKKVYPDKVPAEEVQAGRTELRRMLGRKTQPKRQPPVSTEQFEQLQLEGFQ